MEKVTVEAEINAPVEKVWAYWTRPEHIVNWNFASDDWCCPKAENDLKVGGKFSARMEAKDKSFGFDFNGVYDEIIVNEKISYSIDPMYYKEKNIPGRKVEVKFVKNADRTMVIETFDPENVYPAEQQKQGWQAILNNFKKYVENPGKVHLHFEKEINASPKVVYEKMLGKETYKTWTKIFNPTSDFKGSWEKGSKILFVGVDDKGNQGGMVSYIAENIPNQFLSIEHKGILDGDKEITSGPMVDAWAGAHENYTFKEKDGKTILIIDTDSTSEFKHYFEETWPKALEKLKEICEN